MQLKLETPSLDLPEDTREGRITEMMFLPVAWDHMFCTTLFGWYDIIYGQKLYDLSCLQFQSL